MRNGDLVLSDILRDQFDLGFLPILLNLKQLLLDNTLFCRHKHYLVDLWLDLAGIRVRVNLQASYLILTVLTEHVFNVDAVAGRS